MLNEIVPVTECMLNKRLIMLLIFFRNRVGLGIGTTARHPGMGTLAGTVTQ